MKFRRSGQAYPLKKEQFDYLISAIKNPKYRAIAAMHWYTSERPSTILAMNPDQIFIPGSNSQCQDAIVFPGRTRKQKTTHEIQVVPKLKIAMAEYGRPDGPWLFPGNGGNHLTYSAWEKACKRLFQSVGIPGATTYSFRRGSLTHLAKSGVSIRAIQAHSGHKSLDSLQRYLGVDTDQIKAGLSYL